MKSINIGTPRDLQGVFAALIDITRKINEIVRNPALSGSYPFVSLTTGPYTVLSTDSVIRVNTAAASVTLNLPPAANNSGHMLFVKKITTDANTVTLDGSGAETIDGSLTLVIAGGSRGVVIVQSNGVSWDILSAS